MKNLELHVHHIVPKKNGGCHLMRNLTTLCKDCHSATHDDTMAPTAKVGSGESGKREETAMNPFVNIDPFDKCPICRNKGSFHIVPNREVHSGEIVANCVDCQTVFSMCEKSGFLSRHKVVITTSDYDIGGYEFTAVILKKIEKQGLEDLSELDKYAQESGNYISQLKHLTYIVIGIMVISVIIGILLGNFLIIIITIFLSMVAGFIIIKMLDEQARS